MPQNLNDWTENFKIVDVTPDLARKLLDNKAPNRGTPYARVESLAYEMLRKKWVSDPTLAILLDTKGRLADGQHRLEAVLRTNLSQLMWIRYNTPKAVLTVIDRNRPRSVADSVRIATGDGRAKQKEAALNRVWKALHPGTNITMGIQLFWAINTTLEPKHVEAVCSPEHSTNRFPAALNAALILARPIDPDKIDKLMELIQDDDTTNDTVSTTIRLLNASKDPVAVKKLGLKYQKTTVFRHILTYLFMRCIKAYLCNENLTRLRPSSNITDALDWILEQRELLGLPTSVIPKGYDDQLSRFITTGERTSG